jgi:hypothetical protein
MKLCIILLLFLVGCSPKYEVIQEIDYGQYHLVNTKDFEVIIINTKDSLKEGQIIKWKEKK